MTQALNEYEDNITILDNGVKVVTRALDPKVYQPNASAYATSIMAGARHEGERCKGIAHFVEHGMFSAQITKAWKEFFRQNGYGYKTNAATSSDHTNYAVSYANGTKVSKTDLEAALRLQLYQLASPDFSVETFERERERILNEVSAKNDKYERRRYYEFRASLHPGYLPYGPISTYEDVELLQRSDLKNFYDERYVGSNIVVPVCFPRSSPHLKNALSHDRIVDIVNDELRSLPRGKPVSILPDAPFATVERRFVAEQKSSDRNVDFTIYLPAAKIYGTDSAVQDAFMRLFWDTLSTRIYDAGYAYVTDKVIDNDDSNRTIELQFTTKRTTAKPLMDLIADELVRYATGDIAEDLAFDHRVYQKSDSIETPSTVYAFKMLNMGLLHQGIPISPFAESRENAKVTVGAIHQYVRQRIHGPIAIHIEGDMDGTSVPSLDYFTSQMRQRSPLPQQPLVLTDLSRKAKSVVGLSIDS